MEQLVLKLLDVNSGNLYEAFHGVTVAIEDSTTSSTSASSSALASVPVHSESGVLLLVTWRVSDCSGGGSGSSRKLHEEVACVTPFSSSVHYNNTKIDTNSSTASKEIGLPPLMPQQQYHDVMHFGNDNNQNVAPRYYTDAAVADPDEKVEYGKEGISAACAGVDNSKTSYRSSGAATATTSGALKKAPQGDGHSGGGGGASTSDLSAKRSPAMLSHRRGFSADATDEAAFVLSRVNSFAGPSWSPVSTVAPRVLSSSHEASAATPAVPPHPPTTTTTTTTSATLAPLIDPKEASSSLAPVWGAARVVPADSVEVKGRGQGLPVGIPIAARGLLPSSLPLPFSELPRSDSVGSTDSVMTVDRYTIWVPSSFVNRKLPHLAQCLQPGSVSPAHSTVATPVSSMVIPYASLEIGEGRVRGDAATEVTPIAIGSGHIATEPFHSREQSGGSLLERTPVRTSSAAAAGGGGFLAVDSASVSTSGMDERLEGITLPKESKLAAKGIDNPLAEEDMATSSDSSLVCFRTYDMTNVSVTTHHHTARDRRVQAVTVTVCGPKYTPVLYTFVFHKGGATRFVASVKAMKPSAFARAIRHEVASRRPLQGQQQQQQQQKSSLQGAVHMNGNEATTHSSATSLPATFTSREHSQHQPSWRWMAKWTASSILRPYAPTWSEGGSGATAKYSQQAEGGQGKTRSRSSSSAASEESFVDLAEELHEIHHAIPRLPCRSTATTAMAAADSTARIPRCGSPSSSPSCGKISLSSAAAAGTSKPPTLSVAEWRACFQKDDDVLDREKFDAVRDIIYDGGGLAVSLDAEGRRSASSDVFRLEVWCHLLGAYTPGATRQKRQSQREENGVLYEALTHQWQSILPVQLPHFTAFRKHMHAVDKDVARTDRTLPEFREEESPRLALLHKVLKAHIMLNFDLGYCQGMSDVLALIALLTEEESSAFLCFRHVLARHMSRNFSMDAHVGMPFKLRQLRVLVRHFIPKLYAHLVKCQSFDMSFCFRWVLMCYKREFSSNDALRLWDAVFACPYTTDFDIFITGGLLRALAGQMIKQLVSFDRVLQYANNLSGQVDVEEVIELGRDFYDDVSREVTKLKGLMRGELGMTPLIRPSLDEAAEVCEMYDGPLED